MFFVASLQPVYYHTVSFIQPMKHEAAS